MRRAFFLACFILLALLAGCDGRKESPTTEQKDRVEGVRKETTEAARESRMTADQQKADYLKTAETKLGQYDESIKKLQEKAGKNATDADMKNLLAKRDTAAQKVQQVRSNSTETWEKQKADLDNAFNDLDQQFRYVESKYGK
jgi:predicted Zn-dependent protease